ncbi:oxidoreductase, short chain dehydrogenase/reductase family protein [Pseudooceanicola batsensis HTCC2597]|uniref:Oxidoreductase, short chain dehydrogenase/reductase family protein n=1 Tax=Pseudooceanicola batsensis (strain ATCC BAA-863 / DSM 15984 / KCTC 12145 / HTCC2597) TaxID=252305 RepID=A3U136_PSEBH|nr:SDR family NAD(P)-dependent oxidoreductase [Pseudooceanicola batsensis]EAQ02019.1 oxidoreductase, short chain dehydrogenase/reductase family protein [Pseudooceanicola batsensis HTCC2597]
MNDGSLFDIRGQSAVVTGAANGIGRAMAEILLANGADVTMVDIDDAVVALAREHDGRSGKARGVVADVTDTAELGEVMAQAHAWQGRLDIVCANAGKGSGAGPLHPAGELAAVSPEEWSGIVNLNLTSVFHTIQLAAKYMRPQKSGRIIVTSSVAGLRGETMVGYAYAATKAATANLVRQSAVELSRHNVLINAIAPGPIRTDIGNGRLREAEVERAFAARTPLGRIGEPEEIKGVTLLLASAASSYITGTVIPVDGGCNACG